MNYEYMPYGRVLVVDDTETSLLIAQGLLELYGISVDTAMSGYEAVFAARSGKVYDIIFLDQMMPEMDGMETARELRRLGYKQPIVAFSAYALAEHAEIFLENGFNALLAKPIDKRQLSEVLNMFVRNKQPSEVIEAARKQAPNVKKSKRPYKRALLVDSFIRDANRAISVLEELTYAGKDGFVTAGNLQRFTVTVHGMKSILMSIGERDLSEEASKLEAYGRGGDIDSVVSGVGGFSAGICALLEKLDSERAQNTTGADDGFDALRASFLSFAVQCGNFDRKAALITLSKIQSASAQTHELIDKLSELVMHSEFEEAQSIAEEHANTLASKGGNSLCRVELAGIDIAKGLKKFGGDERLYLRVLRAYAAGLRGAIEKMAAFDEKNLQGYEIAVHSIKGTSMDIFADSAGNAAQNLETAVKSGDLAFIRDNNPIFIEQLRKLLYDIEILLSSLEREEQKPRKDKIGQEVLAKLLNACKAYSMDGIDEAMHELEKYQYETDNELAGWLKVNIDGMNLQEVAQRLSQETK